MTAAEAQHLSGREVGRVVNHRVLGTRQGEREQPLSATLPAIRQPGLAHGRGHRDTHVREAATRREASRDCRRARTCTHAHSQSYQLSPNALSGGAETRARRGTARFASRAARRRAEPLGALPGLRSRRLSVVLINDTDPELKC